MKSTSPNFATLTRLIFGGSIRSTAQNIDFVERKETEAGFTEFYNENIKPHVVVIEDSRIEKLRKLVFRSRLVVIWWASSFSGLPVSRFTAFNFNNMSKVLSNSIHTGNNPRVFFVLKT